MHVFRRTFYTTLSSPYVVANPSVCRLSATLLRPTQRVLFGNIFAAPNSLGIWAVCVKILEKHLKGYYVIVQFKWHGCEKLALFDSIQDTAMVTMEDT